MNDPVEVVLTFIDRINGHDPGGLSELMTEDHLFIDTGGMRVQGRDAMRKAWIDYLELIPDYEIVGEKLISSDVVVGVFGTARGTYRVRGELSEDNRWEIPAAWKAVVREGRIAEWCVFCDLEPLRQIMMRAGRTP